MFADPKFHLLAVLPPTRVCVPSFFFVHSKPLTCASLVLSLGSLPVSQAGTNVLVNLSKLLGSDIVSGQTVAGLPLGLFTKLNVKPSLGKNMKLLVEVPGRAHQT